MKDERFNGWSNYETWAVALRMDNEQGTYTERAERVTDIWDTATGDDIFTRSEEAQYALAEWLKEYIHNNSPELGASLYSDLLSAALGEVDWSEIADEWLSEMDGYERRDK